MPAPKFAPTKAVGTAYRTWVVRMKAYYFWHAVVLAVAAGFALGMAVHK